MKWLLSPLAVLVVAGCSTEAEREASYQNAPPGSVAAACRESGYPTWRACMCRLMPNSCPR